jgi:hypothetical protein
MGIFSWATSKKPEQETEPEVDIEAGSSNGIIGKISQIGQKITQKTDSVVENYQNLQVGLLVMLTGAFFMFLSTFFIPLIPIRPSKFVCLNAFGNICIVTSIFLIRGLKYIKFFLKKDKILFSFGYVASLLGELYFAFLHSSYLMSIVCFVLNFVSLAYILFSFFKNGTAMLNMVFKGIFSCFKSLFKKLFSKSSSPNNESIL